MVSTPSISGPRPDAGCLGCWRGLARFGGGGLMDERELVGLLHRADWTRLALSGTGGGGSGSLVSIFGGTGITWGLGGDGPIPHPPIFTPDLFEEDLALDVAPGQRFRVATAGGRWVGGCDGARVWQWQPELPEDPNAGFRAAPQPPLSQ